MDSLRKNWWKAITIVVVTLLTRVLLIQLLPLQNSSTFEIAPSTLSRSIGLIPTAAIVITLIYATIAAVLIVIQENLSGSKLKRFLLCSIPFSFMWFMGVLESVAALGKPLLPELLLAVTDIIPLLLMGAIISILFAGPDHQKNDKTKNQTVISILSIAAMYFIGRYFLYAVIGVNSGYATNPIATFLWTLGMGASIGTSYSTLRIGLRGTTPIYRSLWFSGIVFGLYWTLNNLFMPIVFDMSFIEFSPTIMNYVYRIVVDIVYVSLGVWISERSRI
jgi:hypothetical protein